MPAFSNGTLDEIEIPRDKEVGNTKAFTRTKLPKICKNYKAVETVYHIHFGDQKKMYYLKHKNRRALFYSREIKTTYERYVSLQFKRWCDNNFDDFDTVYFRKPKTRTIVRRQKTAL